LCSRLFMVAWPRKQTQYWQSSHRPFVSEAALRVGTCSQSLTAHCVANRQRKALQSVVVGLRPRRATLQKSVLQNLGKRVTLFGFVEPSSGCAPGQRAPCL